MGHDQSGSKLDVLAVVLGLVLGPDLLHRQHLLAQLAEPRLVLGAVVLHLLAVPAGADPEQEAAARERIEARHLLRQDDGVALDDETDAGAHLEPLGRGRGRHQRHERVEGVPVVLGQRRAAGPGRLAAGRDVRVLGHEQRLEAPVLAGARELVDADGVVGGEHEDAQVHRILPSRIVRARDELIATPANSRRDAVSSSSIFQGAKHVQVRHP